MTPAMPRFATDILYVITDLELGGVPLHLERLARAMRDRGKRVSVVSLSPAGPVGRLLKEHGVEVASCDGCCGWDVRVVRRLARIIADRRPEIVHSLLFHANVAARWAARSAGFDSSRIVCEVQTVEVERKWHLLVDRFTHAGCRLTIGNSPSVIEHLATHARIPRDRLRLVRGGIDPTGLRVADPIARGALGLAENARIVLWVGRLDPVKGLEILIDAFARLRNADDVHLLLAGNGPLHGRLSRRVEALGQTHRVHLLGSRNDVPSLLRSAEIFAFPSMTEGLPNALLEAMAARCPIITTNVPGCRDLIAHMETGLVVQYGDTSALAEGLQLLLSDRGLAARLGAAASASVSRDWHIDSMIKAYLAVYCEVSAAPRASSAIV